MSGFQALSLKLRVCFLHASWLFLMALPAPALATDIPAAPADRPAMVFPDTAGRTEGVVVLRFTIGADGHVRAPEVVQSSPAGVFDPAALQGVALWLYHPRMHDGHAVAQPGQVVRVTFQPPPPEVLQPVFRSSLGFPRAAYAARQEGTVSVGYDITPLGYTTNVHVISAEPPGIFDRAATQNVGSWEFDTPQAGQPVTGLRSEIVFKLKDAVLTPVPDRPISISYPIAAQSRGIMGSCNVTYWIEENGTTSGAHIRYCVPAGYFEDATLDAVRRATYKPEADPVLNHRRIHYTNVNYRFQNVPDPEVHYLKPGQWIKLRYTLTAKGRAKDVEVIAKSDSSVLSRGALLQLTRVFLRR